MRRRAIDEWPSEVVELGALVGRVVEEHHADSNVPILWKRPSRPMLLYASSRHLELAIDNALRNAVEAARECAEVRLRRHGDQASIDIRDDGPGLPPETRDRAFQPLFTTRLDAAGLGLAVIHGVARAHGGSARLLDGPGGRLRIELPLLPLPC